MSRFRERDGRSDVAHVVRDVLDVEPLAAGLPPPAKIQRVGDQATRSELLARPEVLATV